MLKRLTSLVFFIGIMSAFASDFITEFDTSGCRMGVWTHDLAAARTNASKSKRPILLIFAKSGGCGYCRNAAEKVWNTAELKNWAKENSIPLVYGNLSDYNYAAQQYISLYLGSEGTSLPAIAFVDGADGTTLLGHDVMQDSAQCAGLGMVAPTAGGPGFYMEDFSGNAPSKLLNFYLNKLDNTPNYVENSNRNGYGSKATEISADNETKAQEKLVVNGLWRGWGVNTLSCKYYMAGTMVIVYDDDRQDWYTFDCSSDTKKQEQSYIVTCPTLSGKTSLGYLGVYLTEAKAKKAAESFENAKKYAANWIPMSELTTANSGRGRDFTIPKGTSKVYLCFCRRAAKSKENITLKYTFTLKKGKLDAFEFDKAAESFDEYDKTKPGALGASVTNDYYLTVCRDTAGSTTTASITITNETAVYGTDYFVPGATYTAKTKTAAATVSFGTTNKTAKLPFKVISKYGIWKGDREFTAKIAKDAKSGSSKITETVTIKEVDAEKDASDFGDDVKSGATTISLNGTTLTNRLNGVLADGNDDQQDWFQFTDRDANKIACLKFKPLYKSNSANSFVLKFFKDGQEIVLPESHSTEVTGMDAFTVALPPKYFAQSADIHLCVSNKTTEASHCGIYELSVFQIDQMVATFADVPSNVTYDSPEAVSNVAYRVTVTTNAESHAEYFDDWQLYLPTWRTVEGTAKNGTDFDGTSANGTNLTLSGSSLVTSWSLKVAPSFRLARTLTVELLPDPYGYYRLGETPSVSVTIKGDDVDGRADKSPEYSSDVGRTFEPSTTGIRNLSYTNTVDEIYFANIKAEKPYVLGAEIVQEKNPNETPITVSVWTNGYVVTQLPAASNLWSWISLSTNKNGIATNCYDKIVEALGESSLFEKQVDKKGVATNCFYVVITTNVWVDAKYGNYVDDYVTSIDTNVYSRKNTHTDTVIKYKTVVTTNDYTWIDTKVGSNADGSFNLSDLANDSTMPLLTFAANGTVKVRVERPEDEDVLARYKIKMTQWLMDEDLREGQALSGESTNSVEYADLRKDDAYELLATVTKTNPPASVVNYSVATNGVVVTDASGNVRIWTTDDLPVVSGMTNLTVFSWIAHTNQEFRLGPYASEDEKTVDLKTGNIYLPQTNALGVVTNYVDQGIVVPTNCNDAVKAFLDETYGEAEEDSLNEMIYTAATNAIPSVVTNEWPSLVASAKPATNTVWYSSTTNWFAIDVSVTISNEVTLGTVTKATTNVVAGLAEANGSTEKSWVKISQSVVTNGTWRVPVGSGDETPYADDVSAAYSLGLTDWALPEVAFAQSAWTYDQTNATLKLKVARTGGWQLPVSLNVSLSTNGCANYARLVTDVELASETCVIPVDETNAEIIVRNLMPTNFWIGDRSFKVNLSCDDAKYSLVAPKTATVEVKSTIDEYEQNVPGFDEEYGWAPDSKLEGQTSDNAAMVTNDINDSVQTDKYAHYTRTLHGADTRDCYVFTNLVKGTTYRFQLADLAMTNVEKVTAAIYEDGFDKTKVAYDQLAGDSGFDYKMKGDSGYVTFAIARGSDSTLEKPASMRYTLKVREWPWPTFAFETDHLDAKNMGEATNVTFKIVRTENWEGTNWVTVTLAALTNNAVSATSPSYKDKKVNSVKFAFLPDQEETNWTVSVVCPALMPQGVWTGDWAFQANLTVETDEKIEKVRLGDITNCVVNVEDVVERLDWHDDCDDDVWSKVTTNHEVSAGLQTLGESAETLLRLNSDDTSDWFRFTDIKPNTTYYFSLDLDETKTNNLDAAGVQMTFWQVDGAGKTKLTPVSAGVVSSVTDEDLLVHVYRNAGAKDVRVSAAYTLSFCEVAARVYVDSAEAVSISGLKDYVEVTVVCTNASDGAELSVPVKATVYAERQPGDTAKSPDDFRAIAQELTWEEGTMGGRTKVRVPLTNYDTTWEGDQTFHIRLDVDEDSAGGVHLPEKNMVTNVCVTVLESNPPQYGSVGITGVGSPVVKVTDKTTAVFDAVEGEFVYVQMTRWDGITGDVVLKWYWKDSANKTVKFGGTSSYFYTTNFVTGSKGVGPSAVIPVPEKSSVAESENWKLYYKIASTGVTEASGCLKPVTFAVADRNYGGRVSAYSAGDVSRVAFKASGTTWYNGRARFEHEPAYVRATTPAAGKSVAMTAQVTGPGTLRFKATFVDATASMLKVTGGSETVTAASDGIYAVAVAAGTKTLTFTFTRGTADGDGATVEISNVVFEPDTLFNSIGTFTGPVSVLVGDERVPGLATLTVSSAGKTSGKLQCADKTWTISTNGAWAADGLLAVTAKYGKKATLPLELRLDAGSGTVTNEADGATLELARKVWSDKPVATNAVLALETFAKRHTVALPVAEYRDEGDHAGAGYLAFDVSTKGVVKAAGYLADGRSVSMSVPLAVASDGSAWAYLFSSPLAYKKGWFAMPVRFANEGGIVVLRRADSDAIPTNAWNWVSKAVATPFARSVNLFGGEYTEQTLGTTAPTLYVETELSDDTTVFSPSMTWKTGVFTGRLRLPNNHSYTYRGIAAPNVGTGSLVGGGFVIINGKSYGVSLMKE